MKHVLTFFTLAAILLLTACINTKTYPIEGANTDHPKLNAKQVLIYKQKSDAPANYEKIARLVSSGDAIDTTREQMLEDMKKKAAKLGANGVILMGIEEPSKGRAVASAFVPVSANRVGEAVAIFVPAQE